MRVEKPQPRFALCIRSEGSDDLETRKVYQVLPDRVAARDGYLLLARPRLLPMTPETVTGGECSKACLSSGACKRDVVGRTMTVISNGEPHSYIIEEWMLCSRPNRGTGRRFCPEAPAGFPGTQT